MKVLVTGAAGFIGFHLSKELLAQGIQVYGIDNINDYYDPKLKYGRLELLGIKEDVIGTHCESTKKSTLYDFWFSKTDLCDREALWSIMNREKFDIVVNLAAQAGVRFSIEQPYKYLQSNLEGFLNILEGCRYHPVKHLVLASSSSVYGANTKVPFSITDNVDRPISLYAATKKSNELMAYTYSHLYDIPVTGLRFFTVYGPWGRPDMAYYKFTEAILCNNSIDVFNNGDMYRDFTYIDDIIIGITKLLEKPPLKNVNPIDGSNVDCAPYKIYNIGNSKPESLKDFITYIELSTGKKAIKNMKEMQPGDVYKTYADVSDLEQAIGYKPATSLKEGISNFVDWYKIWSGFN